MKNSNTVQKKLLRSTKNKMVAGVCGGLGEFFNIDPTVIRLLFILVAIAGGSAVLAYIILWIVMPSDN